MHDLLLDTYGPLVASLREQQHCRVHRCGGTVDDMTQVLVAYASKMGATKEIAEAIGARLTEHGLHATVADAGTVARVDDYDAIVLGSAVYAARWRPEAVRFVRRHRAALTDRRTWPFESGWVGTRPTTISATPGARRRAGRIGAPAPTVFGGRLDPALTTGFMDRSIARAMPGDGRDWDEIRAWADHVAESLAIKHGN
jgi:menaquinone-dependent protoporphyrinogen oxidase